MLTTVEEAGIRDILGDLMDADILSLADTVTKRLLKTNDRKEATEAILSCLDKPSDLLKRQRITKRVLFSYLQKFNFVSPENSKVDLVTLCLEHWKSIEKCMITDYNQSSCTDSSSGSWLKDMGAEFSKWFFSSYNSLQEFGPGHFWSDCKLRGELKTASENKEVEIIGADETVSFLTSLIINDNFFFHHNNDVDSITCEQNNYGLVRFGSSGVVHQASDCIGLFDCGFGLVKNPAYNDNWKIKWIHMKIHVTSGKRAIGIPVNQYSICQRA